MVPGAIASSSKAETSTSKLCHGLRCWKLFELRSVPTALYILLCSNLQHFSDEASHPPACRCHAVSLYLICLPVSLPSFLDDSKSGASIATRSAFGRTISNPENRTGTVDSWVWPEDRCVSLCFNVHRRCRLPRIHWIVMRVLWDPIPTFQKGRFKACGAKCVK